ncbi:sensor histidine kinase [Rhodobacter sp.]
MPPKSRFPSSSLGFRLGSTLVLALMPLGILSVVQTWVSLDQIEQITLDGIGGASLEAVRPQLDLIQDAQATARVMAAGRAAGGVVTPGCSERLRAISESLSARAFIAYLPVEGPILCASHDTGDIMTRDPKMAELATRTVPSLSYSARDPVSGLPVIIVAAPIRKEDGKGGAVVIVLPHQAVTPNPYQSDYGLWQPALMATLTGGGELLATDRDAGALARLVPEGLDAERIRKMSGAPTLQIGEDGKPQILSVTRVADDLYLLAVWREDPAMGWRAAAFAPFLLPVLTWAAALLAASVASQRLVVRHVRALRRSMSAYMASRKRAPVPGISDAPDEIQSLHGVYEEMISAIEQDEAELENLLVDKDRLLREVHHRSGNSLQIIASVMRMYRRESDDPALRGVLDGLINRVIALSSTHTSLYGLDGRKDVPMDQVLNAVIRRLKEIHGIALGSARKNFQPIPLPAQTAIPLALALAETVSCHFACSRGMERGIDVALEEIGPHIRLRVEGPDVPEFRAETTHGLASLPRRMLVQFAGQLGGQVIARVEGGRSIIELDFPREPA